VFAVGYMAAIKLAVAVVCRLGTGSWPPFGNEPWCAIVAAIVISTPAQAGEEIGWRGHALPRLAARFGLYAHTNGSVLLSMLMHSAVNQTMGMVPTRLANPGESFCARHLARNVALWCDFVDDGRILPRPNATHGGG
jgi:membrane protease YdiL (CAAX protease family)